MKEKLNVTGSESERKGKMIVGLQERLFNSETGTDELAAHVGLDSLVSFFLCNQGTYWTTFA